MAMVSKVALLLLSLELAAATGPGSLPAPPYDASANGASLPL